jgi:ParB family chromosome partitioning protein
MKHDGHFVDLISARSLGPRLRMIPIEKIDPNPHQARCELGNIGELQNSIKSKGILEPILVAVKASGHARSLSPRSFWRRCGR